MAINIGKNVLNIFYLYLDNKPVHATFPVYSTYLGKNYEDLYIWQRRFPKNYLLILGTGWKHCWHRLHTQNENNEAFTKVVSIKDRKRNFNPEILSGSDVEIFQTVGNKETIKTTIQLNTQPQSTSLESQTSKRK